MEMPWFLESVVPPSISDSIKEQLLTTTLCADLVLMSAPAPLAAVLLQAFFKKVAPEMYVSPAGFFELLLAT